AIHAEFRSEAQGVIAARVGEVADEAVGGGGGDAIAGFPGAQGGEWKAGHVGDGGLVFRADQRDQLLRESQGRQIVALAGAPLWKILVGEAIAHVEQQGGIEDIYVVKGDAFVVAVQDYAIDIVAEVAVLVFLPVIAVDAKEYAVAFAEGVIHAGDYGPIVFQRLAG